MFPLEFIGNVSEYVCFTYSRNPLNELNYFTHLMMGCVLRIKSTEPLLMNQKKNKTTTTTTYYKGNKSIHIDWLFYYILYTSAKFIALTFSYIHQICNIYLYIQHLWLPVTVNIKMFCAYNHLWVNLISFYIFCTTSIHYNNMCNFLGGWGKTLLLYFLDSRHLSSIIICEKRGKLANWN